MAGDLQWWWWWWTRKGPGPTIERLASGLVGELASIDVEPHSCGEIIRRVLILPSDVSDLFSLLTYNLTCPEVIPH